jgi:hypothetical protein
MNPQTQNQPQTKNCGKRIYTSPVLREYGDIRTVTQNSGVSSPISDGSAFGRKTN